jgi:hypothetical protein
MTNGKIFLLNDNGKTLTPMTETGYITEGDLQTFLAEHPDLLPGDQISPESPRRWLLVAREMGIPGAVHETGRWSLDHLFLDQDGTPTFVECKRSQDTRARREVVAQMLDYAANGIEYWSLDRLRQSAAETAQRRGLDLDQAILDLFSPDEERTVEEYWQTVEANLRNGKVRLIFVLDQASRELRRLVEFLNEKMADVEVLIVEIRQFLGEAQTALVPRVLGITEHARSTKTETNKSQRKIDRSFVVESASPDSAPVFLHFLDAASATGCKISWGTKGFSVRAYNTEQAQWFTFVLAWPTNNDMNFYMRDLPLPPDEVKALRQTILNSGFFSESGYHTLSAPINATTRDEVIRLYNMIMEKFTSVSPGGLA